MMRFKVCGIAAGAALLLSFLIGLISGNRFPVILLKALLFAVLFFAIGFLVSWLINRFIPDLLSRPEESEIMPGSMINLSVGSGSVEGAFPEDTSEEVDDIEGKQMNLSAFSGNGDQTGGEEARPSRGLDQKPEERYNKGRDFSAESSPSGKSLSEAVAESLGRTVHPANDDLMPDFDSLSEAFGKSTDSSSDMASGFGASLSVPEMATLDMENVRKPRKKSDEPDFEAFDPEEMAKGIQTLLKKDEKG